MRRYLLSAAATVLAVVGLAASPSPARADHHDWNHHYGWHPHHAYWGNYRYGGPAYYAPYRPRFYIEPYTYPSYVPYSSYVYPSYGYGYYGPYFSFSIGP